MENVLMSEIEKVLDEKVRPDLSLHGGGIHVVKLEDDVLHVRLVGHCSGCPSADLTMENLVNEELKAAFPQLRQVVLVAGVSDSLISEAREMLKRRHS